MDKEEYEAKRRELIERASLDISDHESAGEFGDAENVRRWLRFELKSLKREYEEA